MNRIYTALGTMSGTSLDGIDFSIIQTDGEDHLSLSGNNYLEFSNNLKQKIRSIKSKIISTTECKKVINSNEYKYYLYTSITRGSFVQSYTSFMGILYSDSMR